MLLPASGLLKQRHSNIKNDIANSHLWVVKFMFIHSPRFNLCHVFHIWSQMSSSQTSFLLTACHQCVTWADQGHTGHTHGHHSGVDGRRGLWTESTRSIKNSMWKYRRLWILICVQLKLMGSEVRFSIFNFWLRLHTFIWGASGNSLDSLAISIIKYYLIIVLTYRPVIITYIVLTMVIKFKKIFNFTITIIYSYINVFKNNCLHT